MLTSNGTGQMTYRRRHKTSWNLLYVLSCSTKLGVKTRYSSMQNTTNVYMVPPENLQRQRHAKNLLGRLNCFVPSPMMNRIQIEAIVSRTPIQPRHGLKASIPTSTLQSFSRKACQLSDGGV